MKFPSLQSLYSSFIYVIRRFPLEIAFAFAGVIAAIINIEISSLEVQLSNWCVRVMMVCNLGLVLALSATLYSEANHFSNTRKYLLRLTALGLAVGFLFLLDPLARETDLFRFFLLAAAFHLLVAVAAFPGRDHITCFWQFNKTLFLRFLAGALYSGVLFLGLAAAIGSMNLLFNFEFESDTFAILWVVIAGLFQTVFFLSGIPEDLKVLEGDKSYPKGLKVFTQYVLIPLASVYVVILLAYEIKILITWDLPKGLVSNLILGYAVFGILSLLLIYPVRNFEENKWLKTYSKSFYFLLVPLILLLIWAVAARVIDYGITEQRYFLIILALWLAFITGYFLLSNKQDIRVIPVSLCMITLIVIYGPQGAFAVSQASQKNQLRELFGKYGALENGKLKTLTQRVDSADRERMVNVITYLVDNHGMNSIQSLTAVEADGINTHFRKKFKSDSINLRAVRYQIHSEVKDSLLRVLNIPAGPATKRYGIDSDKVASFQVKEQNVVPVGGYQRLISFNKNSYSYNGGKTLFTVGEKVYLLKVDSTDHVVMSQGSDSVSFDIDQHLEKLLPKIKTYEKSSEGGHRLVPDEQMIIDKHLGNVSVRLYLQGLEGGNRGNEKNKDIYVIHYSGVILVK
jgi:hypothetical protein